MAVSACQGPSSADRHALANMRQCKSFFFKCIIVLSHQKHWLWPAGILMNYDCIAGNKFCSRRSINCNAGVPQGTQTAGPDISLLDPVLQNQWDHTANRHLGPIVIKPHSGIKVWWHCDQCPDGHLHSWAATVQNRSNGTGCPQCSGQKVCKHNSLATKSPLVAAEWHPISNTFSPEYVIATSNKSAVWQCQACSHVWTARLRFRVARGSGCPICSRRLKVRAGKRHRTLADSNNPLLKEWDHSRNAALGMFPDNITPGSAKKVFWLCPNCPAGQKHSYSATPNDRTRRQHPTGCPYCAGRKACKCNSLHTHYPQLASEWDFAKNEGTPDDHTAHSCYMAWWTSAKRGSWQQSIDRRTQLVNYKRQKTLINSVACR